MDSRNPTFFEFTCSICVIHLAVVIFNLSLVLFSPIKLHFVLLKIALVLGPVCSRELGLEREYKLSLYFFVFRDSDPGGISVQILQVNGLSTQHGLEKIPTWYSVNQI